MSWDELNAPLKRLARYARVSTTVGGLAARVAGEKYLGLSWNHETYAATLEGVLGRLKGPVMKIGQILATVPDILPAEYAEQFLQLQSAAPPMGWGFVRRRMAAELGPDWHSLFSHFEKEATAAASLGQVHRGANLAGEPVACKLQYPDMITAIDADLKQLSFLLGVYERSAGALSTENLRQEMRERLLEELDYCAEAQHVRWFAHMLEGEGGVHVPHVFPELSTARLLTMSWAEGDHFLTAKKFLQSVREEISQNLFRAFYLPLYQYGILHADPHLGNYTLHPQAGQINLLDFGCVRVFPPTFVEGSINLYHALYDGHEGRAIDAYHALGFGEVTRELLSVLNVWARFLYGPLLEDTVRPIDREFSGQAGKEVAFGVHEKLKEVGGVTPPREFVFMHRAAVGMGSAAIHLKVEMNWCRLFHTLIDGFTVKNLQKNQDYLVKDSASAGGMEVQL